MPAGVDPVGLVVAVGLGLPLGDPLGLAVGEPDALGVARPLGVEDGEAVPLVVSVVVVPTDPLPLEGAMSPLGVGPSVGAGEFCTSDRVTLCGAVVVVVSSAEDVEAPDLPAVLRDAAAAEAELTCADTPACESSRGLVLVT